MSVIATSFLTYVWHYLAARTIYDHVLRPITHGSAPELVLLACVGVAGFALGRVRRRAR